MIKVLILAFGNPDNVFTLARHVSEHADLTLAFAVSGEKFTQGIMDLDIKNLNDGLNTDSELNMSLLGSELRDYAGNKFKLWFIKTPSRKFLTGIEGIKNYGIIKRVSKQISVSGFDAVHFNGTSGFLLYFLKHIECGNRIWTLHDYKPHSGEENKTGDLLNRIYTKFNIKYIQHYDYLKNEFVKYFGVCEEDVHRVYSGAFDVYSAFLPVSSDTPENYMLFFGRFSKYKGIDLLVNAYRKSGLNKAGIKLVLAGAGECGFTNDDENGMRLINRHIQPGELSYLIEKSLCIITPYTDSTHSGVIMTSYAFNKPVISSDVGGIKEVVKDKETGMLFESGSDLALSECMTEMCGSKELRESMSGNIKRFKSEGNISWDKITKQMIDLYSNKKVG